MQKAKAALKTDRGVSAGWSKAKIQQRIQRTFDTYRNAVAFQKEALAQVEKREYVKPSTDTVKKIAEQWHEKKVEAGTYKRSSLNGWRNHVDDFIIADLGTLKVG